MKTSKQWWNETKANPEALTKWLKDQYHGEQTAFLRLNEIVRRMWPSQARRVMRTIAIQEMRHADWIGALLRTRGIQPKLMKKGERYWAKTLPADFANLPTERIAAIAAHAEKMRLERILAIVEDQDAPADIHEVFAKILPQEEFHERAFREIAGVEHMDATLASHEAGMAALGLIA